METECEEGPPIRESAGAESWRCAPGRCSPCTGAPSPLLGEGGLAGAWRGAVRHPLGQVAECRLSWFLLLSYLAYGISKGRWGGG